MVCVVHVEQDAEPAHPHEQRDDGEDVPVAKVVGETGNYQRTPVCCGPGGDRVELGFDFCSSVSPFRLVGG
jgi:hypothetical protein